LVVSDHTAFIKGVGLINGRGSFDFVVTAVDGEKAIPADSDKFRIRIRDQQTKEVVYDNQPDSPAYSEAATVLERGSVVFYDIPEVTDMASANTGFSIYPNPARGYIFVETPFLVSESAQISILNRNGVVVSEHTLAGFGLTQIDVSQLPVGVYYIVLKSSTGYKALRFLKE
jgi:hypothetical protein